MYQAAARVGVWEYVVGEGRVRSGSSGTALGWRENVGALFVFVGGFFAIAEGPRLDAKGLSPASLKVRVPEPNHSVQVPDPATRPGPPTRYSSGSPNPIACSDSRPSSALSSLRTLAIAGSSTTLSIS